MAQGSSSSISGGLNAQEQRAVERAWKEPRPRKHRPRLWNFLRRLALPALALVLALNILDVHLDRYDRTHLNQDELRQVAASSVEDLEEDVPEDPDLLGVGDDDLAIGEELGERLQLRLTVAAARSEEPPPRAVPELEYFDVVTGQDGSTRMITGKIEVTADDEETAVCVSFRWRWIGEPASLELKVTSGECRY